MKRLKKKFRRPSLRPIFKNRRKHGGLGLQEPVPRITNETVAEHREAVLGSARKYIYPLQQSKHKIVLVTTALFIVTLITFFTYTTLALYRFQHTSTFLYRVTQVIPFPVARSGSQLIAYENYLFELRHYMHFYEVQQDLNFDTPDGQRQLTEFKHRALEKVVNDAYAKRLAEENKVTVSAAEVDEQIDVVRNQNRLGGSDTAFEDVLNDFWGWSIDDFRRSLSQQLLAQKVAAALDIETNQQAQVALAEIKAGADFAAVAQKYSEDLATKDAGGEFGFPIDRTNRDLSAKTTQVLFGQQPGQVSDIVNIGYALQILKTLEKTEDRAKGAHILFNFKDITDYVNDVKEQRPARLYLNLPPVEQDPGLEPVPANPGT